MYGDVDQFWVIYMDYFKKYFSNTYAGSSNQTYFTMDENDVFTGRIFYKIANSGNFGYSLLFSNTIDSTYSDGSISQCNMICDSWKIIEAKVGICKSEIPQGNELKSNPNEINDNVYGFVTLTFNGNKTKKIEPGELFYCDEFQYEFEKNDYLCLEITYSGKQIPYHEESLLPIYVKTKDGWTYCQKTPLASMIGCNRKIKSRIAFLGDSITQGIGTPLNSYLHWNAIFSENIGDANAYWNLGIGYGRARDIATNGSWLYKAKQNDMVIVCCGVNDILHGGNQKQLIEDLDTIVDVLLSNKIKVVLQTIPPFDYVGEKITMWKNANKHIKEKLSNKVDCVFDVVPYLSKSDKCPQEAKFGGHPNSEGCRIWADGLTEILTKNLL